VRKDAVKAGLAQHVRAVVECDKIVEVVATNGADDADDLFYVLRLTNDAQGNLVACEQ